MNYWAPRCDINSAHKLPDIVARILYRTNRRAPRVDLARCGATEHDEGLYGLNILWIRWALLFVALVSAGHAAAADNALSASSIKQHIQKLKQASPTGNGQQHKQLLDLYQQALKQLQDAHKYRQKAKQFKQAAQSAPARTRDIRNELAQEGAHPPKAADYKDLSTDAINQRLTRSQTDLSALKSQMSDLENQIQTLKSQPDELRSQITQAKNRLDKLGHTLKQPLPDQPSDVDRAQRVEQRAAHAATAAKVDMLEQQSLSHDARLDLLNARRDRIQARITQLNAELNALTDALNAHHRAEANQAEQEAKAAKREAQGKSPLIQKAASENTQLSQQLSQLVSRIEQTSHTRAVIQKELQQLDNDYQNAQQQLSIAGLTTALGQVLREQRRKLPDLSHYQNEASNWKEQIADARLQEFHVSEQQRELADVDQAIQKRLNQQLKGKNVTSAQRAHLGDELRPLIKDRQTLLSKLSDDYARYLDQLTELRHERAALIGKANQYAKLLDESLVWIASGPAIGLPWLHDLGSALVWLVMPQHWLQAAQAVANGARGRPILPALSLLSILGLLWSRRGMRRRLPYMGERIGNVTRDRFHYTVEAILIATLLAAPGAIVLAVPGWLMAHARQATEFTEAVGFALERTAIWLFILDAFRRLFDDEGLVHRHFHWREPLRQVVRRNLVWLMAVELPCTFLVAMTQWKLETLQHTALGRLAFIVGSIGLAVFFWILFRRRSQALSDLLGEHPQGWRWRVRYLVYPLFTFAPLVLSGLAAMGYYFTALQLEGRLFLSGWLVIGALLVLNLIVRWVNVAERRLALARARVRRETLQAQRANKEAAEAAGEGMPETLDVPEIDLATISDQTRELLRVAVGLSVMAGLWLIWNDMLPALNVLDNITLWHQTLLSGGTTSVVPITLGNLGLALMLLILAVTAGRNLPGFLEITLLRRLSLEPGNRYAITTICRYVILGIGLLATLNALGIGWHQAQWLIAALGVGLGFGLQEIFANFVSGLIILFERPIRVGDTVTVGNVSGTVSRIRIRATTITDWDRKELVVPNKTFITDQVINWTLTDPITRVIVRVGVSYDADPARVQRLLLQVADENAMVLDDPAPQVFFLSFGDSALNFELRVFVRELAHINPATHELNVAIERILRDNGIAIPYPHREIHVKSYTPWPGTQTQDNEPPGVVDPEARPWTAVSRDR